MNITFKKTEKAIELEKQLEVDFTPTRGTDNSIGYDLRACVVDVTLFPDEVVKIPTGIHIDLVSLNKQEIDAKLRFGGFIYPRSGLGTKGFVLANTVGVIDVDYQGELIIMGYNRSEDTIHIKGGDRIAQLVLQLVTIPDFGLVEEFKLTTERGEGGFGSTGV